VVVYWILKISSGFFSDENELNIKKIGDTDLQNTSIICKQYTLFNDTLEGPVLWHVYCNLCLVILNMAWAEDNEPNLSVLPRDLVQSYDNSNLLPLSKEWRQGMDDLGIYQEKVCFLTPDISLLIHLRHVFYRAKKKRQKGAKKQERAYCCTRCTTTTWST
jgi:hypothetical protein